MSWQILLYAVLSLTAVVGPWPSPYWHARATVAFMGWFGGSPRGLASIVFAVMVEDAHLPHSAEYHSHLLDGRPVGPRAWTSSPLVMVICMVQPFRRRVRPSWRAIFHEYRATAPESILSIYQGILARKRDRTHRRPALGS